MHISSDTDHLKIICCKQETDGLFDTKKVNDGIHVKRQVVALEAVLFLSCEYPKQHCGVFGLDRVAVT